MALETKLLKANEVASSFQVTLQTVTNWGRYGLKPAQTKGNVKYFYTHEIHQGYLIETRINN